MAGFNQGIGSGITRPLCSGAKHVKFPCVGGLEFGGGSLN